MISNSYWRNLAGLVIASLLLVTAGPSAALSPILKELQEAFISLGEEVRPSVVNIEAIGASKAGADDDSPLFRDELYRYFGIDPAPSENAPDDSAPAQGSGFILDREGHILTNYHVLQHAETVAVRLWDNTEYTASIVGIDPPTDIAVIQIDAERELVPVTLGDSDGLSVGQFAVAVGSPRGLESSMTFGHISALGREGLAVPGLRYQGLIQTDAAINLGNSGGPLCNLDGEVIGINTALVTNADALGFAIPINTVKNYLPALIREGKVSRGYLGIVFEDAARFAGIEGLPFTNGAYVVDVRPDTPARRAGIQPYDVIRSVDGVQIEDSTHLRRVIADYKPGDLITMEVYRGGIMVELQAILEASPDEPATGAPSAGNLLGLVVAELSEEQRSELESAGYSHGVRVDQVQPQSPADMAGIQPGTVILEIAKQPVRDPIAFDRLVQRYAAQGEAILCRIVHEDALPKVVVLRFDEE